MRSSISHPKYNFEDVCVHADQSPFICSGHGRNAQSSVLTVSCSLKEPGRPEKIGPKRSSPAYRGTSRSKNTDARAGLGTRRGSLKIRVKNWDCTRRCLLNW